MYNKWCAIFFSAFFSWNAYAHDSVDMTFKGKPIDALCFFNLDHKDRAVDLKKCGFLEDGFIYKGVNTDLIKKGYIGYNWQDPSFHGVVQGYSYYRLFKAGKHSYWIYSVNSGGGSGDFTSLYLANRKTKDSLEIKHLVSGDRCNGGVQNVSEKDNRLQYSVNLTAYDFVTLSKNRDKKLTAYDDLAACAVCCVAKAYYSMKLNSAPILQYIELTNYKNLNEMPVQGAHQACFNKLFMSYSASGKTQFKQININEFKKKFDKLCLIKT